MATPPTTPPNSPPSPPATPVVATIFTIKSAITIGIILFAIIAAALSVKFLGPNNAVEEIAEEVIKAETGLDIDLTPSDTKATPQPASAIPQDTR